MKETNNKETKKIGKIRKIIRNFYPTYIYENVESIPLELLKKNHIELIMLDMDNTLIDTNLAYSDALVQWTKTMKQNNIRLCILSNSPYGKVVKKIASELGMEYYYNASKPFLKGFVKIMDSAKAKRENILMVGDQLFTDVWGGNRFGVKTVLVHPINEKEMFITKIKRPFENIILKHYLRKKGES